MTITLNVENEQLFNKILSFLNRFTNEGLEIITNRAHKVVNQQNSTPYKKTLPKGFFNPIEIESYNSIASRNDIYER